MPQHGILVTIHTHQGRSFHCVIAGDGLPHDALKVQAEEHFMGYLNVGGLTVSDIEVGPAVDILTLQHAEMI